MLLDYRNLPKAATLSQSSPRMSIPTRVTTPMTPMARPSARDLLIRSSMPMRQPITAARMGTAAIKIAVHRTGESNLGVGQRTERQRDLHEREHD